MEFKKFASLTNHYQSRMIDHVVLNHAEDLFLVTEKVHGANFSFWYDGREMKIASRNQFVDLGFFNVGAVASDLFGNVEDFYNHVCETGDILTIYGELCGPGIQREVDYGHKQFLAFDVVINRIVQEKVETFACLRDAGFRTAPVIESGISFEQAMSIEHNFKSLVYPEADGDNFSEGLVVEPVKPRFMHTGERVYIKKKTQAFMEKKNKIVKPVVHLSDADNDLLASVLEYATDSRVLNVISKIGEVTTKDFGDVSRATVLDILDEYQREQDVNLKEQFGDSWKIANKAIWGEVQKCVRNVLVVNNISA